ncbi:hypothetical protein [Citricoccus zhacaiensis]|nr:hypothetical protein [Citricoccus zhacaiensis]
MARSRFPLKQLSWESARVLASDDPNRELERLNQQDRARVARELAADHAQCIQWFRAFVVLLVASVVLVPLVVLLDRSISWAFLIPWATPAVISAFLVYRLWPLRASQLRLSRVVHDAF